MRGCPEYSVRELLSLKVVRRLNGVVVAHLPDVPGSIIVQDNHFCQTLQARLRTNEWIGTTLIIVKIIPMANYY